MDLPGYYKLVYMLYYIMYYISYMFHHDTSWVSLICLFV